VGGNEVAVAVGITAVGVQVSVGIKVGVGGMGVSVAHAESGNKTNSIKSENIKLIFFINYPENGKV
jgi:hypothetical protein